MNNKYTCVHCTTLLLYLRVASSKVFLCCKIRESDKKHSQAYLLYFGLLLGSGYTHNLKDEMIAKDKFLIFLDYVSYLLKQAMGFPMRIDCYDTNHGT